MNMIGKRYAVKMFLVVLARSLFVLGDFSQHHVVMRVVSTILVTYCFANYCRHSI